MGGWKLEVFRFSVYIFFPVACFHLYHKDNLLDDSFRRVQSKIYPAEEALNRMKLTRIKEALSELNEKEKINKLKKELELISASSTEMNEK
nr:protein PET100 homolog, mitochondrial-like [Lepeophtheirus salmonis]